MKSKRWIKVLTIIMAMCIAFISMPVSAVGKEAKATLPKSKISESLSAKLKTAGSGEEFLVYLWYTDIDHSEVDRQVKKDTGLTKDNLSVDYAAPDDALLNALSESANNEIPANQLEPLMKSYLEKTKSDREKEQKNMNRYIKAQRDTAKKMIVEKSAGIIKSLKISKTDIVEKSEYGPVLIVTLSKQQIESYAKRNDVTLIGLYEEPKLQPTSYTSDLVNSTMKQAMKLSTVYQRLGLNGDGVNIGISDGGAVGTDAELNPARVQLLESNPVIAGHATWCASVAAGQNGVAPNANILSVSGSYIFNNNELLLSNGANLVSESLIWGPRSEEYSLGEQYRDYLTANYGMMYINASGNNGSERIQNPATAYNNVTVNGFSDNLTPSNYNDDFVYNYTYDHGNGCYKPDVISQANIGGGGTSTATPVISGTLALLIQLKPSLATQPHALKAILLSSCHRKINTLWDGTPSGETMEQGLTNKQGAGVPNAFTAVSIVINETYGTSKIVGSADSVKFAQLKGDASKMNVSIAWLRENDISTMAPMQDVDLQVYDSANTMLGYSVKGNSSTELAYFNLSGGMNYRLEAYKYGSSVGTVRYGYAWSTDQNYAIQEGAYFLKNKQSGLYLDLDASGNRRLLQYYKHGGTNQQWIIKRTGTNTYSMTTNWPDSPGSVTRGDILDGNGATRAVVQQTGNFDLHLTENSDGTVSITHQNPSTGAWDALEIYDGSLSALATVSWYGNYGWNNQKWYLEPMNYQKGDANLDGIVNPKDAELVKQYVLGQVSFNEIQKFCGDFNGDNAVNSLDMLAMVYPLSQVKSGVYYIVNRQSGKYLEADTSDYSIRQANYSGGLNQQWNISDSGIGDNSFYINTCVSTPYPNMVPGPNLDENGAIQAVLSPYGFPFAITYYTSKPSFSITTGSNALEIYNGSLAPGALASFYQNYYWDNQLWYLIKIDQ